MSEGKSNVVVLGGVTTLPVTMERVFAAALEAKLQDAVVLGIDPNGTLYFAGTTSNAGDILMLLEVAKRELLSHDQPFKPLPKAI